MTDLPRIKIFLSRFIVLTIGMFFVLTLATNLVSWAQQSSNTQRDCDNNAVIRCGVSSVSELHQKYAGHSDIRAIYDQFGINGQDISQMHTNAVTGQVTRNGNVIVNGQTVATNAVSAGRQNIAGSTKVTNSGVTFYTRPTAVSFSKGTNSLDAYVMMNSDKQFSYAVVKSCGNPVMATPVPKPKPVAPPAQAPVQPTPAPVAQSFAACSSLNTTTSPNRTVTAIVGTQATNAKVISYTVDFGDGTPVVTSSAMTATHQYIQDGTYTITASIQAQNMSGDTQTFTSEACKKTVTFSTAPTPVTVAATPPTPAPTPAPELPHTGANMSEIFGLSSLTAFLGTALHFMYTRRSKFM